MEQENVADALKPICVYCVEHLFLKTVFGKLVWCCPRCNRHVSTDIIPIPEGYEPPA